MRAIPWLLLGCLSGALACGTDGSDGTRGGPGGGSAAGGEGGSAHGGASGASPDAGRGSGATASADSGVDGGVPARRCNGREDLCDRAYDRVVFPGAHNAHSTLEYGYMGIANQVDGIDTQLQDGVRLFLLDVYASDTGETIFCHGVCSIASTPHVEGLSMIKTFLDQNPNEVITFIYEDHVDTATIATDLEAAGLAELAFSKAVGAPWPTLGEMIDGGTRLVVTAENGGPPPEWIVNVWDVAFDTPYTFTSVEAFSCDLNRGSADNALFLLNHWVSQENTLPSEAAAPEANAFDVLYGRATRCAEETSHVPTFVAVDFYAHGDLFAVVDALNDDVTAGRLGP